MSVNLDSLMANFKQIMSQLIHEKASHSSEHIEFKIAKTEAIAQSIFQITGGDEFKEIVQTDLSLICKLKPGRVLVKALKKYAVLPIEIKEGPEDQFVLNQQLVSVCIKYSSKRTRKYYTIFDEQLSDTALPTSRKETSPSYIKLAHEMIHFLHYSQDNAKFNKRIENVSRDVFPLMDSREEQLTITGIDEPFLTKRISEKKLEKSDLLCENAFLLALQLAPRNCHRERARFNEGAPNLVSQDLESAYYKWIETNLHAINHIPPDKKMDKEFIKEFVLKYPKALKTIDSSLKQDEDFFIDIAEFNSSAIKYFPSELLEDVKFLQALVDKRAGNFFYLPKDIRRQNIELARFVIQRKPEWFQRLDQELKMQFPFWTRCVIS